MRAKKRTIFVVIGSLNLLLGVGLAVSGIFACFALVGGSTNPLVVFLKTNNSIYECVQAGYAISSLLGGTGMIVASVGLMVMHPWARSPAIFLASFTGVSALGCLVRKTRSV